MRGGSPHSASWASWVTWGCAVAVLIVTWRVFQPALDGQWLRWDDDQLLLDRSEWRGFRPEQIGWMFTTFHMGPYQPLSWLSYAFDHATSGLDPRGYHATNVALHAASAVCLFFLARSLFALALSPRADGAGARSSSASLEIAAALSALAWSIHPLRVESVAWITERRDCLSGLFFLATLLAWIAYATSASRRRRWYWLAVIAFAASLLSKGLGLVLPFVLLALDVWPLRRLDDFGEVGEVAARVGSGRPSRWRALVLEKSPFWALAVVAGVLAVVGQKVTGAMVKAETHDFGARIVQAFYGLAFYVRKSIWPDDLMVMYPMRVPLDPSEPRFVASIVGVVAIAIVLLVLQQRATAAVIALACYALLVAPVLGLVQSGSQLVADRYSYLPTIPLILLAGGVVLHASRRLAGASTRDSGGGGVRGALLSAGLLVLFGVALVPLARATARQIPVWHDTMSLWRHDVAIDPTDNPGRRSLLAAYEVEGRAASDPARRRAIFERALEVFREGDALAPDAACLSHAAKLCDLLAADEPEQRERHLTSGLAYARRAVALVETTAQRLPDAYESAGVILSELGRPAEGLPYLEKLVSLDPRSATRLGMLAEVLMQAGRHRDALAPLAKARELDPTSMVILLDLGDAHRQLGQKDEAVAAYRLVIEARRQKLGAGAPADPEYAAAAQALAELGRAP